MGPKRRSSETADEQIIKQGCLIKSPPTYPAVIFNNKASWKPRKVKLCSTTMGSFILRYYAYDGVTERWKGDIHMNDIKSIELGTDTMDWIPTITGLFKNSAKNILCIKTEGRNYYLVDGSVENIAEWQKALTDAWKKVHQKMTIEKPTNLSANLLEFLLDQEELRPKSYPANFPHTQSALAEELNRQRALTDPVPSSKESPQTLDDCRKLRHKSSIPEKNDETQDSETLREISIQIPSEKTCVPEEVRRNSAVAALQAGLEGCRLSDDSTETAYWSDTDSVYATPRSILVKSGIQDTREEETSDLDSDGDGVYQRMSSIFHEDAAQLPSKPPRKCHVTAENRYMNAQGSQLKKAHLLRMRFEANTESDLESITLPVPKDHLQEYLGLQEVGERLCVSKWKGPLQIGCLFHHGDHIDSINGIRTGSKEFFFQILNSSISSEVSLGLIRNKKAAVFHLEGCSCDTS